MILLALTILTAMCAAAAPTVLRAWHGESSLVELPRYSVFARVKKKDRIRAGSAAFLSACLLCVTGWVVFVLAVGALWMASFVGVVTVVLGPLLGTVGPPG